MERKLFISLIVSYVVLLSCLCMFYYYNYIIGFNVTLIVMCIVVLLLGIMLAIIKRKDNDVIEPEVLPPTHITLADWHARWSKNRKHS